MNDFVIVGGGIFGKTIAASLRKAGAKGKIVDSGHPKAGSRPSACLMKPSWFASLGKHAFEPAIAELDSIYELKELKFQVGKLFNVKVFWINPQEIMAVPATQGKVIKILDGGVRLKTGEELKARHVIVAAGVWSGNLMPVDIQAKAGWGFYFPGQIKTPFIKPWAPYRQISAFNIDNNNIWVGDTTALKPESATDARREQSADRCSNAIGRLNGEARAIMGYRPYCNPVNSGDPCYLNKIGNVWIATGGGKNGTLAAGWCAYKLRQALS